MGLGFCYTGHRGNPTIKDISKPTVIGVIKDSYLIVVNYGVWYIVIRSLWPLCKFQTERKPFGTDFIHSGGILWNFVGDIKYRCPITLCHLFVVQSFWIVLHNISGKVRTFPIFLKKLQAAIKPQINGRRLWRSIFAQIWFFSKFCLDSYWN